MIVVQRVLRDTIVPAASRVGPIHDGYIAARGRPDRLETVLGCLRELSGETEISRPGRPMASGQPDPALATIQ